MDWCQRDNSAFVVDDVHCVILRRLKIMLCVRQQIIQMWRQEAVELLTAIFEAKIEC